MKNVLDALVLGHPPWPEQDQKPRYTNPGPSTLWKFSCGQGLYIVDALIVHLLLKDECSSVLHPLQITCAVHLCCVPWWTLLHAWQWPRPCFKAGKNLRQIKWNQLVAYSTWVTWSQTNCEDESLWYELKECFRCEVKFTSKEEWICGTKAFWATVTVEKCRKYTGHLKKVISEVINWWQ